MNLLVGLAIDDISEVRKFARVNRISMKIDFCLNTEYSWFSTRRGWRQRYSRAFLILKEKGSVKKGFLRRLKEYFGKERFEIAKEDVSKIIEYKQESETVTVDEKL